MAIYAMRFIYTLAAILLLVSHGAHAASAAEEKAVRMKTSRQLKEILTELKIKFPKDADKEELREIALEKGAIAKWEARYPAQKKRAPGGGPTTKMDPDNMAEMLFPMLDKDGDGRLARAEMPSTPGDKDESFAQMDADGDGYVTKPEANAFFKKLQAAQQAGMGGAGGAANTAETTPQRPASEATSSPPKRKPQPVAAEDEDELPSHDEL